VSTASGGPREHRLWRAPWAPPLAGPVSTASGGLREPRCRAG